MAARPTSTKGASAKAGSATLPKGVRIPQPALFLWSARTLVIGALVLFFISPAILAWADMQALPDRHAQRSGLLFRGLLTAHSAPDSFVTDGPEATSERDRVAPFIASITLAVLSPRVVADLGKIGIFGVCLMLGEALVAVWGMARQQQNLPRTPTTYLLLRATMPNFSSTGRMGGASTHSGDHFYRALQKALPVGTRNERHAGTAPWVALTLSGIPDQPIEVGVVVADRHHQRRAEMANAIRAIIQGQVIGAQLDEAPDPLGAALRVGVTVGWREYGLRLPTHYPLRFLDDIEGSDLLGPLVAALAPRGTLRTEAQIIVRPAKRWALNWGWRGNAMALKLKLEAKADYALSEDAKRIEAKLDAAPFEATIRMVVVAEGADAQARVDSALSEIAQVLGEYHQGTSHQLQELTAIDTGWAAITATTPPLALTTRAPRFAPPPELLLPIRTWRISDIMTSLEIAGLWHPPSGGLGNLIRWLPCKIVPAPPQAYIAPNRADRVMVGMAKRADGTVGPVGPTLRDLRPPMHITAGMGAGKSRALANICRQCIPHGFILLDGKGDDQGGSLAATVRQYIPLADEHRLLIFDILDTDWPVGLNPLVGIDLKRPGAKDQALGQIMAIFARLDPATWGKAPAMKEFVQMATLLVLEGETTPTLAHVKQCLLDASYRETLLPHCTNPDVHTFWTVTFPAQGEQQRSSLHALLRRFSQLLTTETTRYMVSQPASRLNLLDAIETQQIVLAPLPHVTLGDLASAVGMLFLQQFVRSAFARPGTDQTRHTYPLIIDELQVFIGKDGDSTDIQNAITQLRGLGIAGIYAHQTLDQLGALKDEMLTNSGSRLMLRTQEPDASTYAKLYAASGITANDIAGQDANEHQYAVLQCDGVRTGLFSMAVLPWPEPLHLATAEDPGDDWQMRVPPDSPDPAADAELLQIIYHSHIRPANIVQSIADYCEDDWNYIVERWEAIRRYHRQYILDHPGCIAIDETISDPDPEVQATKRAQQQRLDRQRWLSRLLVATPRILAAAEYARIRRQIEPADGSITLKGGRSKGAQSGALTQSTVQTTREDMVVGPRTQLTPEPIVPIGFVSGATPQPGSPIAAPQVADTKSTAEVMETRGRRRAKDDIASGFDDLNAANDNEGSHE